MKKSFALLLFALFTILSCKDKNASTTENVNYPEGIYAEIKTTNGLIVTELFYKQTPITVANFVSLAQGKNPMVSDQFKNKPFYDGLTFHRVIADFMIQGGDPLGDGLGDAGYSFNDEIVTELKHNKAGILSMANSGPNTNGSQFFITHNATPHLDGMHTVFGQVIDGQDVVNQIAQGDKIESIKIILKGKEAEAFDAVKIFTEAQQQKINQQNAIETTNNKVAPETKAILDNALKSAKTTNTGLKYYVYESGNGVKPKTGEKVNIMYAGYFTDGKLFDTNIPEIAKKYGQYSEDRMANQGYEAIPFQIGMKDGLIPGFIEGIENLKKGDKAYIFIPSKLGYGERGAQGVIPPNTDLVFEIHLK